MKAEVVEVEDPINTSVIWEVEPEPELGISPPPPVSAPPAQFESRPSLSDKPLLLAVQTARPNGEHKRTPRGRTPNFLTPLGSPIRRALQMTKLDAHDAWLPITESRNGNLYYAAFHTLCSGIGIQALVLPVALTILGWTWGVISLTVAFFWQLYTLWVLVKLHESTETGMRYSRYLHLFNAAFGERMGKIFALFPIMYLAGGTCVALIVVGGSTSKLFFQIVCGEGCTAKPLTTVEWYLVFASAAVVLSQLPNLNSIAGVSLVGATTAIAYCTIMWVVAVTEGRLDGVSYNPIKEEDNMAWIFSILNALGIIAFAFRGHNLILEIQGTMPSYEKKPSHIPMWRGVKIAYLIIALCLYPLAIGGYWAYGHKIPPNGGMLTAIYQFHGRDTSQATLGLTSLFVIINAVSSFQIYGMPMFDDMESKFTVRMNRPCPWWLRALFRVMFGYGCFFVAVAIPFLGSLAGLIGGMAVPITFAYPSFMWLKIKKPKRQSFMWYLNWGLGISGTILSVLLIAAGVYVVIDTGIEMGMSEVVEVRISPRNGLPEVEEASPAISAPPFQLHYSPSLTRTPKSPFTSRMMTPIASPMKKAITSMQVYLEEVAHFTKLNPQEDWLPITESRNGNLYYSAFHTLSSGIGAQALVLPLAFTALGEKMGKILALFPIMYLSGGTCVALIMIGGGTMKLFFEIVCADTCKMNPLSTIEWYLVFTCCAIIIAQLPNLNSIAGVSLVGAITAISYCTLIWVLSISRGRPGGVSYEPPKAKSDVARGCSVLNAIGVIAFAFRGHNVVLEIQGTMPSSPQKPSRKAMWAGVKFAYLAIGMCLFPLAVGGYWEYGDLIPANQGMLSALYRYHRHNTSRALLGLTSLLVVVNSLSSFQIYAMPVFDNLEFRYTSSKNRPCPRWLRSGFRVFFGCLALFISVAFPFLPSLAGLIGGIALPITLAYPCLMWILIKKPRKYGATWLVNGVLGVSGMVLSVLIVAAAIWSIVTIGIPVHFFKPK